MRETTINGRWSLLLPEHRANRAEWATGWEPERLDSMYANLKPGDVIYDVGTEEGDMTGLFAKWVDTGIDHDPEKCDACRATPGHPMGGVREPSGGVVVIEPNPLVWPNIRAVFDANNLPDPLWSHVGFVGAAVGFHNQDWDGEFNGRDDPRADWPRCAYGPVIGDHGFLNLCERPDVPVTTIDHIASKVGCCDAITVDVEGAELAVMRGATRTLNEHRPLVWISVHPEFGYTMYETYANDLHSFMHSHGYVKRWLAFDHEEHWVYCPDEKRDAFVLTDRADWT